METTQQRTCQYPDVRPCPGHGSVRVLTFETGDGMQWSEAACQSHLERRTREVQAVSGRLVSVSEEA